MKDLIITMLREIAEYADANLDGNVGGYDSEYVRNMADAFEEEK